jgi:two-component system LytT family response regulator
MTTTDKKIKALIIDDEAKSRNTIAAIIRKYSTNTDIVGEADSVKNALKAIDLYNPNLLLLDVNMPFETGFDLLKQLPKRKYRVIFITAYEGFALRAIKFHAFNYILKPVNIDELINTLNDLEEIIDSEQDYSNLKELISDLNEPKVENHKIAIPAKEGREYVQISDIVRLMADGSATWIYINDGRKVISSKNLGEYEKLLPKEEESSDHFFMRVHHKDIINFNYIAKLNKLENFFELKDGSTVNIAQRKRSLIMKILKKRRLF